MCQGEEDEQCSDSQDLFYCHHGKLVVPDYGQKEVMGSRTQTVLKHLRTLSVHKAPVCEVRKEDVSCVVRSTWYDSIWDGLASNIGVACGPAVSV